MQDKVKADAARNLNIVENMFSGTEFLSDTTKKVDISKKTLHENSFVTPRIQQTSNLKSVEDKLDRALDLLSGKKRSKLVTVEVEVDKNEDVQGFIDAVKQLCEELRIDNINFLVD